MDEYVRYGPREADESAKEKLNFCFTGMRTVKSGQIIAVIPFSCKIQNRDPLFMPPSCFKL